MRIRVNDTVSYLPSSFLLNRMSFLNDKNFASVTCDAPEQLNNYEVKNTASVDEVMMTGLALNFCLHEGLIQFVTMGATIFLWQIMTEQQ